jgi:hypothetical protein
VNRSISDRSWVGDRTFGLVCSGQGGLGLSVGLGLHTLGCHSVCLCIGRSACSVFSFLHLPINIRVLTTHRRVTLYEAVWWNVRVHSLKMRFFCDYSRIFLMAMVCGHRCSNNLPHQSVAAVKMYISTQLALPEPPRGSSKMPTLKAPDRRRVVQFLLSFYPLLLEHWSFNLVCTAKHFFLQHC